MADDLVNRAVATTMIQFKKGWTDCMSKKLVEWFWIKKVIEKNCSGRSIEWRTLLSLDTAFGFTGGMDEHTATVTNNYQVATLDWRGLAAEFVITYKEKKLCKGDKEIIGPLVGTLAENTMTTYLHEWARQFYGAGTRLNNTAFHGLLASIATPGTYAGISQSTYANFASQYIDGTGFAANPLSFLLQLQMACAKGARGGRDRAMIDIFLTGQARYRSIMDAIQVQQRFVDEDMAKAGFQNVLVHGTPLAWSESADDYAPTLIYGLNSKQFEYQVADDEPVDTGSEVLPGWPHGLTRGWALALHQLLNKNPRASGVLYNCDV